MRDFFSSLRNFISQLFWYVACFPCCSTLIFCRWGMGLVVFFAVAILVVLFVIWYTMSDIHLQLLSKLFGAE